MDDNRFIVPSSAAGVDFTGERYVPGIPGQIRTEHIHRYLFASQFVQGRDVLDVACGEGYGSHMLGQIARSVVGVDIAADVVQRANEVYGSPAISFRAGDATEIPVDDHSVDVVVCFETIEHVADQNKLMSEIRRVLRENGTLVISTPNATADDGAWHEGNPFHVHELTRQEFTDLLKTSFAHVSVGEQRMLHGSVISHVTRYLVPGQPENFDTSDGTTYTREQGSLGDSYFVAVASDQALSFAPLSIQSDEYEQNKLVADFRYAVATMHDLEARLGAKDNVASEVALLRAQLKRLVAGLGDDGTIESSLDVEDADLAAVLRYIQMQNVGLKLARAHAARLSARGSNG